MIHFGRIVARRTPCVSTLILCIGYYLYALLIGEIYYLNFHSAPLPGARVNTL